MSGAAPSHVEAASIIGKPLTYEWDDKHPRRSYYEEVPRVQKAIVEISDRGILVLCAGIAQWIAFRLSTHTKNSTLFDYIDVVRACAIDLAYTDLKENAPSKSVPWEEFRGKELGPIAAAAKLLGRALEHAQRNEDLSMEGMYLANLTEHVLPDSKAFRKWRNWAIDRLVELTPADGSEFSGRPIPLEALDPAVQFEPKEERKRLRDFLKTLDPKKNRFLRSAAEMKKAGFKGSPYDL